VLRTGLRTEYSSLQGKLGIDPRASLAYKLGREGQVSLAYGKFRQTAKNQYVRYEPGLQSERANHYIVSYQLVNNNRTFRAEAYLKEYKDLVKYTALTPGLITNAGNGYAKGFEFFWRDNRSIQNVDYWVSYSFLNTERDYLNYPNRAVPTFASKHNLSVVYKHFISSWKSQAGFTWSYTSGRPYHNPNESGFNQSKTLSYQDLSFNWSYLYKPWVIMYFSCTNLLGRGNIFGYEYASQPNGDGLYAGRAIKQPASRFAFIGIFITLSKDKSVTQLPTL
jgi:outer membrane cobalamin receptor